MKRILLGICLVLSGVISKAQFIDSTAIPSVNGAAAIQPPDSLSLALKNADPSPEDSIKHNKYGDILADDPAYNPKYPLWVPITTVIGDNIVNWAIARYGFKYDWAKTGPSQWKTNFKKGPEWDSDGFGMNFIGHPHTGSFYFNIGRSNGYSFWQSLPFAIEGSALWEYFGENTRPSYNDLINTPVSGMFLGEVFYRISSNILDDRTKGGQRVFRELVAAVINPTRAFDRLIQGKMFRVTSKEVYQKEPLNITLSAGIHKVNDIVGKDNRFGTGSTNAMLNMQLDYGDPFEIRSRKPFDLFRVRVELSYGSDLNLLDHVNGYGLLAGKNLSEHRLIGLFQHYDYWHNPIFEVASLGFGGGFISQLPIAQHSNIYSNAHLAVVPLAGNNNQFGPIESEFRQYNFGGGMQAKLEETINLHNWCSIGFTAFYYWIHTYNGLPGNSLVGILKPAISFRLFKDLGIGFEHHIYHNDRFLKGSDNLHITRTEQKLFLQFFLEDSKRTGRYH